MPALADRDSAGAKSDSGLAPTGSARWGDLRKRTLSALIMAPLALLCIWMGAAGWTVLLTIAAVLLGLEWAALCGFPAMAFPGASVPLALVWIGLVAVLGFEKLAMLLVLPMFLLLWWGSRSLRIAAGAPYLGIPLVALVWLRGDDVVGRNDILFVVAVVWASDIGAYVVGRLVGGPKLAPAISPGKTWSGAIGGLLIAALVGAWVAHALAPGSFIRAAVVAGVLAIASALGDLLESWIKRRYGVKDSGRLIPGHGGLLDRLDGLLAAAPAAAALALVIGRGGVLWQ